MDYDESEESHRFGESVATLHELSEGFATPYQRMTLDLNNLLDTSLATFLPYLNDRPDDLVFVKKLAEQARSAVASFPVEDFDRGFCHGDFHGGNVHSVNGLLTHFDFDCCGFGLRVFDLATFKWDATLCGQSEQRWPHFLQGYRSVRDFADYELALVDTFMIIRHFWWIGLMLNKVSGFEYDMIGKESIDDYLRYFKKLIGEDEAKQMSE